MGKMFYVVFGDMQAGGYGYWLGDSEEQLRGFCRGEKYIDDLYYGSFSCKNEKENKGLLDQACGLRDISRILDRLNEIK